MEGLGQRPLLRRQQAGRQRLPRCYGRLLVPSDAGRPQEHLRMHQGVSGDGFHRGPEEIRRADADRPRRRRPDCADRTLGISVVETRRERIAKGLRRRAARSAQHPPGSAQRRLAGVHQRVRSTGLGVERSLSALSTPSWKEQIMRIAIVGATGLVGSALVRAAQAAEHDVIALSKESGVDVLQPEGLADLLGGAEAVVDVTQSPSLDEDEATRFFARAAENLGRAGTAAGVQRSVVLSIIGVDQIAAAGTNAGTGNDGYFRAKYAHEEATRAHAPGARVVRSAQFHDIARQAIGWGRDGDRSTVPDLVIQPVAVDAMVEVLLDAATGEVGGPLTEVAGPRREQLAMLSTAYAERTGDPVTVVADPVGDLVRDGVLLPHDGAVLVGPTFTQWLSTTVQSGATAGA